MGTSPRSPAVRAFPPAAGLLALGAVALAGCGGGSEATAGEPKHTYDVKVLAASFPAKQAVAKPQRMILIVQNASATNIPNVTVTVDSFNYRSRYPGLSDNRRPVWVIEKGPGKTATPPVQTQEVSAPGGGQTVYVNTWALGPLAPHGKTTFVWKVVPVKPGSYTVHYAVAAGLAGNAKAQLASGGPATGRLPVTIEPAPPETHVDPNTGEVVPGPYSGPS